MQFLEPQTVGTTFAKSEWPLHCTLAGVFSWQWSSTAEAELRQLASNTPRFASRSLDTDHFGEEEVCLIEKVDELTHLHEALVALINSYSGTFAPPHFLHDRYTPHATTQLHAALPAETPVSFDKISLVDLAPDSNRQQRRVIAEFPFSG